MRSGRLVVVTGTGTAIGKTHFAEALLGGLRLSVTAVGIKPVESGVTDGACSDAARLAAASSFHVKHSDYVLKAPLSPHLAARDEGVVIRPPNIIDFVQESRKEADVVVVELAGGLFSPVTDAVSNADLAASLAPDALLLIAPDRIGVLHDVAATTRAASAVPLRIDGIIVMAPDPRDASTDRNAGELPLVTRVPILATLPRGTPSALAHIPAMQGIVAWLLSGDKAG